MPHSQNSPSPVSISPDFQHPAGQRQSHCAAVVRLVLRKQASKYVRASWMNGGGKARINLSFSDKHKPCAARNIFTNSTAGQSCTVLSYQNPICLRLDRIPRPPHSTHAADMTGLWRINHLHFIPPSYSHVIAPKWDSCPGSIPMVIIQQVGGWREGPRNCRMPSLLYLHKARLYLAG